MSKRALIVRCLLVAAQSMFLAASASRSEAGSGVVVDADVNADTTWTTANSPVTVRGDRSVAAGVTLTIEAGVEVRMEAGASLTVNGTLVTQGTSGSPVLFHPDNGSTTPGYWDGLKLASTSISNRLDYTTFEYGGGGGWQGTVRFGDVSSANLKFNYCTIRNSASAGLYMDSSTGAADFTNGNVENCNGDGIYMGSNANACSLNGNIVRNNIGRAYAVGANKYAATGVVDGNGFNGMHLLGSPTATTSGAYGINVRCEGDLTISTGATVTLGAGITYQAANNTTVTVQAGGQLVATGTEDFPVTVTPSSGRWRQIKFNTGSSGNLGYCILDQGGLSQQEVISFYSPTSLTVDHCEIRNAAASGSGDYYKPSGIGGESAGNVTITNNNIHDNAGFGVALYGTFPVNGATGTSDALKNNRMVNNARGAYWVRPNVYPDPGTAEIAGNGFNGIVCKPEVYTTVTGTYKLPVHVFEYQGKWQISAGATVTFQHSVTFDHRNQGFTVYGGVTAVGSAGTPLTFAHQTPGGEWAGFDFASGSTGTLTHCVVDNVYNAAAAVYFYNPASLSIRNCEVKDANYDGGVTKCDGIEGSSAGSVTLADNNIHDNDGYGIIVRGTFAVNPATGASDDLKNNRLVNNAKGAYGMDANIYPDPGTAEVSGNGYDGISLDCDSNVTVSGTYLFNCRWGGSVWYSRSGFTINSPATVTLLPGKEFRATWTDRYITVNNGGRLVAEGTADQPITFGPTGDFQWRGIEFGSGSSGSLKYCIFDRAGSGRNQVIGFQSPASLVVDNCEIKGAAANGGYYPSGIAGFSAGNVTLTNNNIHDNGGHGFDLQGTFGVNAGTGTSDQLKNNRIVNNARRAFVLDANIYPDPGTAEVSGNGMGNVIVFNCYSGNVTASGTYKYDVDIGNRDGYGGSTMSIRSGATLTLEPGRRVYVWPSHGISIIGNLVAEGTADQPITFTGDASSGSWNGLDFNPTTVSTLRHCKVEYAGSSSPAIYFSSGATLTVDNCEISGSKKSGIGGTSDGNVTLTNNNIHDNQLFGLELLGSWTVNPATGTSDRIKNNTIRNNTSYAFMLNPNIYPEPGTAVASGNGNNGILYSCYAENATVSGTYKYDLSVGNPPGYGGSAMTIRPGTTVTITPGRTVTIWDAHSINVMGKLVAEGTAGQHILFTGQSHTRGAWGYINCTTDSQASLKYCDFEFGGSSTLHGMLFLQSPTSVVTENCTFVESNGPCIGGSVSASTGTSSLVVRSSTIGKSNEEGMEVTVANNGAFTLENCTVRDNAKHGVYLRGSSDAVDLVGNTVTNNGGDALNIDPDMYPTGSTISGNTGFNGIVVDGAYYGNTASRSGTYEADVHFLTGLVVQAGKTVTIAPGKTVRMSSGRSINAYGEFRAQGTGAQPILITSAATTPARGDWGILNAYDGGTVRLAHAIVEYGSSSMLNSHTGGTLIADQCVIRESNGTGVLSRATTTLTGTQIYNNSGHGVQFSGSGGSLTGCTVRNNGQAGIYLDSGTGNTISQCAIYSNGGLGIDISPIGVTANDPGDTDTGANNKQNYPVLSSAVVTPTNTVVSGTLDTQTGVATVDFFANDTSSAAGQTYLGSTTVNVASVASFQATLPAIPAGKFVTATATLGGNTSEFSAAVEAKPAFSLSATTYSVDENVGNATITVNLSSAYNGATSVQYATSDGTAAAGSDYTATSGTLSFAANETSKSFQVPVANDTLDEEGETFTVTLSNPASAGLASPTEATVTIADNDDPPTVAFSAATGTVAENGGNATVTAILSGASGKMVTVKYATSDGTATAAADYTAASGTLTFAAGETSKSFTVAITDDSLDEADESVGLALSDPGNATLGAPASATLTITDNDDLPTVTLSAATYSVAENAGNATITATLSPASGRAVTVQYATSDGTATAGSDYTAASGTLTFAAGETSKTFPVAITNDTLSEENETVNVALSNPGDAILGTPASAVLTVTDDDALPAVAFSAASYVADETAASATIAVTLSAASGRAVTVQYATSDGTATAGSDYTAASGTLTFAAGETSKSFAVSLSDDQVDESDETVTLALSAPVNATLGAQSGAVLTLRDNEGTPTVYFQSAAYQAGEAAGAAAITVGLSGASSQAVTVQYATNDGTATAGSDYTAASGTLTLNPGETSKTFQVPITNDTLDEADETVGLTLSNPANADPGTPLSAVLTISDDDDAPTVAFTASSYAAGEGAGFATIGVALSAPSSLAVTVDYATGDGTATVAHDYTGTTGTLTFLPGETSKSFTVAITDDALDEVDETVALALSNPSNAAVGAPAQATLTITNNNGTPTIAFAAAALSVSEDAGPATVTVSLSAASGKMVTVRYATSDGTATAGSDYTAASGTLTFAPGETSKTFQVPVAADALDEPDETVALALSGLANANPGSPMEAVLTIADDDAAPQVAFSAAAYSGREDAATLAVTVILSAASGRTVTVQYATGDGTATAGADYTAASGTLTFAPGETSKTVNLAILDDALDEGDETVSVALSNAANATLGNPAAAVATLQDVEDDRLSLTSVTPASCENFGNVDLTVRGRQIREGATAWLAMAGESNVAGGSVQLLQGQAATAYSSLKAHFSVSGIKPGKWDVVVRNTDGGEARLAEAVTVTKAATVLHSVTPDSMENVQRTLEPFALAVLGEKLLPASTVTLSRGGKVVTASDVVVAPDGKRIDFRADLVARDPGVWMVDVSHPNGTSVTGSFRLTQCSLDITLQPAVPVQRVGRWEILAIRIRNAGDAPARGAVVTLDISKDVSYRLFDPKDRLRREAKGDGVHPIVFNTGLINPGQEEVWNLFTQVSPDDGIGQAWPFTGGARFSSPANRAPAQTPRAGRLAPLVVIGVVALVSGVTCWIGSEVMDAASWNTVRRTMALEFFNETGRQMTEAEWQQIRKFLEEKLEEMDDDPSLEMDLTQELGQKLVELTAGTAGGLAIKPAQEMAERFVGECQRAIKKGDLRNDALENLLRNQRGATSSRSVVRSYDPNIKLVSQGDGAFVRPPSSLGYTVQFENKEDASAAAQEVIVTDVLDEDLDLDTFAFGEYGWGAYLLPAPADPQSLSHDVDLRPARNLVVQIRGTLDKATRTVTWTFRGMDPTTNDLAWPGFLPPNKVGPEGEGFMSYTIQARGGLANGTEIRNKASIVFDVNAPITTNEVVNVVDTAEPTSRVRALGGEQVTSAFTVSWSGQDSGSGIAGYSVYVAEDDGEFKPWLIGTEETSAQYVGRFGHRYRFLSRAVDRVGNEEGEKAAAEAETRVGSVPAIPAGPRMVSLPLVPDQADPLQVFGFEGDKWARYDPQVGAYVRRTGDPQGFTSFGSAGDVPGRAYWAYFSQEVRPSVSGTPVDFTDSYAIPLKKGWNMIGSPYLAAVPWDTDAILVNDSAGGFRSLAESYEAVESFAWGYDGTSRRYFLVCDPSLIPGARSALEPWQGYWVLAYRDATLILPPPTRTTGGASRGRRVRAAGEGWSIGLQVRGAEGASELTLGEAAGRGLALPMPPAPPVGGGSEAALLRDGLRLSVDVRQAAPTQEWEVLVPPSEGETTLTWPNLAALPKATRLMLTDAAGGATRSLRTTAAYRLPPASEPRHLRIRAERSAGPLIAITGLEVAQQPGRRANGARTVRFQLSTAASVDVEVMSPTGKSVATLTRARAADAGMNLVSWTGTVPRGIYLVRVRATTEEGACAQAVKLAAVVE